MNNFKKAVYKKTTGTSGSLPNVSFSSSSSASVNPFSINNYSDIKQYSGTLTITGASFTFTAYASIYTNNSTTVSNQVYINGTSLYAERANSTGTNLSSNSVTLGVGTYSYSIYVVGSGLGGSGGGGINIT